MTAVEAIRTVLRERRQAAVIAVVDAHGETLLVLRMSGAPFVLGRGRDQQGVFCRAPTPALGRDTSPLAPSGEGVRHFYYGDPPYVGSDGGLPILVAGEIVGAVGASGLTDEEDEALSALGVQAILRHTEAVGTGRGDS